MARRLSRAPPVLQTDFRNSLLAAYRVDEVERQLVSSDLDALTVEQISDRHLLVARVPSQST